MTSASSMSAMMRMAAPAVAAFEGSTLYAAPGSASNEATGYCLAIKTDRYLQHPHVKALLRELMTRFGRPLHHDAARATGRPDFLVSERLNIPNLC